jgi:glyoxylase-like metal-dependent hydrolase (beta-lactamase superfamily II)
MQAEPSNTWFTVKQLSAGLYGIGEFSHLEEVISFLLVGEKQCLLVDTGMGLSSIRAIVTEITDLPCHVINTHSHFDHVGGNSEFSQISMFDDLQSHKAALHGYSRAYLSGWTSADQFNSSIPNRAADYYIPSFSQARFFGDGAVFSATPFYLQAIHTPGHSDDSVCFFDVKSGCLFAGDLLYDGPIYIEKDGGLMKFRRSIERVCSLVNLRKILSSHNYFEFPLEKFRLLCEAVAKITTLQLEDEVKIEGRLRLLPY